DHAVLTKGPVAIDGEDFTAKLTGSIGKDRALSLDGLIEIPPHVIAKASDRFLVPVRPIPLKLRIFGEVGDTKIELLELKESVAALRGAIRNAIDNAAATVP